MACTTFIPPCGCAMDAKMKFLTQEKIHGKAYSSKGYSFFISLKNSKKIAVF
jgi:hypothetical protein